MEHASATAGMLADRGSRREAIVRSILDDIIHGRATSGQRLVTAELAQRFEVSHTPIREALITLAGMGIIELAPNRGAMVRKVTSREVLEVGQVRRALECEAVRRACGRIVPAALRALEHEFLALQSAMSTDSPDVIVLARVLDSRLHDLIADSSDNGFLIHELQRLTILFRAFRDAAWEFDGRTNASSRLAEEIDEHLAIVRALAECDRRRAVRAMSHHIRTGVIYWTRALPQEKISHGRKARFPKPKTAAETSPRETGALTHQSIATPALTAEHRASP